MAKEEQIKDLAHVIWEQEGRPEDKHLEHYFRAKKILEEKEAASLSAKKQTPSSTLQPPAAPKPVDRHTGKRRSKKA